MIPNVPDFIQTFRSLERDRRANEAEADRHEREAMSNLVVTQGGRALADQALGVRLFKDAARANNPRPYRISPFRTRFGGRAVRLYFKGREVGVFPSIGWAMMWLEISLRMGNLDVIDPADINASLDIPRVRQ